MSEVLLCANQGHWLCFQPTIFSRAAVPSPQPAPLPAFPLAALNTGMLKWRQHVEQYLLSALLEPDAGSWRSPKPPACEKIMRSCLSQISESD